MARTSQGHVILHVTSCARGGNTWLTILSYLMIRTQTLDLHQINPYKMRKNKVKYMHPLQLSILEQQGSVTSLGYWLGNKSLLLNWQIMADKCHVWLIGLMMWHLWAGTLSAGVSPKFPLCFTYLFPGCFPFALMSWCHGHTYFPLFFFILYRFIWWSMSVWVLIIRCDKMVSHMLPPRELPVLRNR